MIGSDYEGVKYMKIMAPDNTKYNTIQYNTVPHNTRQHIHHNTASAKTMNNQQVSFKAMVRVTGSFFKLLFNGNIGEFFKQICKLLKFRSLIVRGKNRLKQLEQQYPNGDNRPENVNEYMNKGRRLVEQLEEYEDATIEKISDMTDIGL